MLNEFKEELVNVVRSSTAVLNDEDALAIVEICRRAADREIASATEEYLAGSIDSGEDCKERE